MTGEVVEASEEVREEVRPLVTGERIAWVTKYNGMTSGVSAIHRVYDEKVTYCSREIPSADRRFVPLKSLHVCSRCETMCSRAEASLRRESA